MPSLNRCTIDFVDAYRTDVGLDCMAAAIEQTLTILPHCCLTMPGSSACVSSTTERPRTRRYSSISRQSLSTSRPISVNPALLTRKSICSPRAASSAHSAGIACGSDKSDAIG